MTTAEELSNIWMEHFEGVLNQPEHTNLIDFEQETSMTLLDVTMDNISIEGVTKSTHALKNNKAGGMDELTAELLKHGGETLAEELTYLFNLIWQAEDVSGDRRRGAIVKLPKKGNLSECNNWRGITLLSIPGKVFCSVLLNQLRAHGNSRLGEEHTGIRNGRSCSEHIFTWRTINEQSLEHQTPMIINFNDFKKLFDSMHRESLWKILKLYGVPDKIINIFKTLYLNSSCCVKTSVGNTEIFDIKTGVMQDCNLSHFLFLVTIDFVMTKALDDASFGIEWGQEGLTDLDFADDISALSLTLAEIQCRAIWR